MLFRKIRSWLARWRAEQEFRSIFGVRSRNPRSRIAVEAKLREFEEKNENLLEEIRITHGFLGQGDDLNIFTQEATFESRQNDVLKTWHSAKYAAEAVGFEIVDGTTVAK